MGVSPTTAFKGHKSNQVSQGVVALCLLGDTQISLSFHGLLNDKLPLVTLIWGVYNPYFLSAVTTVWCIWAAFFMMFSLQWSSLQKGQSRPWRPSIVLCIETPTRAIPKYWGGNMYVIVLSLLIFVYTLLLWKLPWW